MDRPLLWLSVTHPGLRHAGNQVYSGGMLDALGATGQAITLLTQDDGPPIPGVAVVAVPPQRFRPRVLGLGSRWPASVWQLAHPRMRQRFRDQLATADWRAVVIDQAASGWVLDEMRGSPLPLVYVAHNQEGTVRTRVADGEPAAIKRTVMRYDAAKYRRLERNLVSKASLVTAITVEDARAFAQRADAPRVLELTPGYDGTRVESRSITAATPRRVVLVGRFEWAAKQQNLRRWAEEAVPILATAGIETQVIGTVPPMLQQQVERPGLRIVGRTPVLAPHFGDARIGLVAEEVGGGFKLKTLDYIFHRLPVAALADNLTGQPEGVQASALVAETPETLARAIADAIDDLERLNRMQQNAFVAAATAFDWHERARRFLDALDDLNRNG